MSVTKVKELLRETGTYCKVVKENFKSIAFYTINIERQEAKYVFTELSTLYERYMVEYIRDELGCKVRETKVDSATLGKRLRLLENVSMQNIMNTFIPDEPSQSKRVVSPKMGFGLSKLKLKAKMEGWLTASFCGLLLLLIMFGGFMS